MRPDGRRPDELRPVEIAAGYLKTAEGSALITIGNTQVLSAMDRAGMIRLEWPVPPDVPAGATDEQMQEAFASYRASMSVRILDGDLADETAFRRRLSAAQQASRTAAAASSPT